MARTKTKPEAKQCLRCQKDKKPLDFYLSNNTDLHTDGRLPYCKECLKSMVNVDDVSTVKDVLQKIDRPFIYHVWVSALQSNRDTLGEYMKCIQMHQYRDWHWKDSIFETSPEQLIVVKQPDNEPEQKEQKAKSKFKVTDVMVDKWGFGYSDEEYSYFERKYDLLKNNYSVKTAMHDEALKTYVRYRVKEEIATAKGDVKEAKEWGALASKAAEQAKINPNQLSKNDLTDGLDNFGALARMVEQSVDIVSILPHLKERPQDKADFVLWNLVNYVRDLKGMPPCEYEEIYKFYDERRKEYENKALEFQETHGDES